MIKSLVNSSSGFKWYPYDSAWLFNLLNTLDNYKILKSRAVRSLLLIQFKSIMNLESFREMILNSKWDEDYKKIYLDEIDTFERIFVKNIWNIAVIDIFPIYYLISH